MADRSGADSTDEYIAEFPLETQEVLEQLRPLIKATAPDAEETISYAIPTFEFGLPGLNGNRRVSGSGEPGRSTESTLPGGECGWDC